MTATAERVRVLIYINVWTRRIGWSAVHVIEGLTGDSREMGTAARDHADSVDDAGPGRAWAFLGVGAAFVAVTLALTGVFRSAEWYADGVSIARYCDDPRAAAERVHRILSDPRPAEGTATRPYVVAAKLIFLVPQRDGEADQVYADRLTRAIEEHCR